MDFDDLLKLKKKDTFEKNAFMLDILALLIIFTTFFYCYFLE